MRYLPGFRFVPAPAPPRQSSSSVRGVLHGVPSSACLSHRIIALTLWFAILIAGPAVASEIDVTTGQPTTDWKLVKLRAVATGCHCLWDLTHGVYYGYEPAAQFSELVALLSGIGVGVSTTNAGVENVDLSSYSILVINVGSAVGGPYTAPEVEVIKNFVANGGSLLIMGDNSVAWPQNINPVAQAFGTTTGLSVISPLDLPVGNFVVHPIFAGVTTLFMRAAGEISGVIPSQEMAFAAPAEAVVTVTDPPAHVVAIGDINIWDNFYLNFNDNRKFAANVFSWLCGFGTTRARPSTWGRVKVLYR